MTTRRDFLKVASGAAAAVVVPVPVLATVAEVSPVAAVPARLGFYIPEAFGRDSAEIVWAASEPEALLNAALDNLMLDDACPRLKLDFDTACEIEDCECSEMHSIKDVIRAPMFDEFKDVREITPTAFHRAGFGQRCIHCEASGAYSRHHNEWTEFGEYKIIDGQPVCHECMTYGDWLKVDPAYAAEMLDEMLTEEYGEAIGVA